MLVYLDTAEISILEGAWQRDAALFRSFLSAWAAVDGRIVISLAIAREIAGIRDAPLREIRLAALRELGEPAVTHNFADSVAFREGEAFVAFPGDTDEQRASRVAMSLFVPGTHDSVKSLVEQYVEVEARVLEAETLSAEAQNTQGPSKMWRLPKGIPSGVDVEQMIAAARAAGEQQGLAPELLDQLESMARQIADSVLAAGGLRPGLVNHFGLSGFQHIARAPDSDLSILSVFAEEVRGRVREVPGGQSRLLDVDFYALPGLALELAYHRALAAHGIEKTPSALRDRDHLVFAPYVDLLTVDKRTYAYLEQEVRHRPELLPSGVPRSLRRVRGVRGIVEALGAPGQE